MESVHSSDIIYNSWEILVRENASIVRHVQVLIIELLEEQTSLVQCGYMNIECEIVPKYCPPCLTLKPEEKSVFFA